MKRMSRLLYAAAAIMIVGTAISYSYAQSVTGRALFTYPTHGQTPDQENADRSACHDWAVAQTGYDPTLVYAAQQAGIPVRAINSGMRACGPSYERPCFPQSGGIAEVRGKADIRRLNELYDAYLRAGQVCLEARGYQVSR
jgi:hypothetical protein